MQWDSGLPASRSLEGSDCCCEGWKELVGGAVKRSFLAGLGSEADGVGRCVGSSMAVKIANSFRLLARLNGLRMAGSASGGGGQMTVNELERATICQ